MGRALGKLEVDRKGRARTEGLYENNQGTGTTRELKAQQPPGLTKRQEALKFSKIRREILVAHQGQSAKTPKDHIVL